MVKLPAALRIAALSAATTCISGVALAAEEGGLPQISQVDTYASQIFWLFVTFGLLYIVMSRVALPRIGDVIEERRDKIDDDLMRAETIRSEAEDVLAEYEKALSVAREEATGILQKASDEAKAKMDERHEAFSQELAERTREAEERIGAAKTEALKDLASVAADTATATTDKLVGFKPDSKTVEQAVQAEMKERL
ncbi:F0F1 ATP synthase subunit B family protein [Fodinicurvata sediminis]|uniref:F0F1 ATP synthase subunit B family protein n=1 Tax=Fodinicurvata sediminis TaxID=1121832 RepID=UPI0003B3589F|nr:ATP synthase subunit B [Fodinicurvata sediminis]